MKSVKNWTKEDAVSFIESCMIWIGAGFHPDTAMNEYVVLGTNQEVPTFTPEEAAMNQEKLDKAFELLGESIYECGMELGYKLGYYPAPAPEKVMVTVLFGEEAIHDFNQADLADYEDIDDLLEKVTQETGMCGTFSFESQGEADAFMRGVEAMEGFYAYMKIDD